MNQDRPSQDEGAREAEVPRLRVEQLALGELEPEAAAAIRERLGQAADDELAAIDQSNREILSEYPAAAMAARIRARAETPSGAAARSRGWAPWVFAPTLVAATAALVWIVVGEGGQVDDGTTPTTSAALIVDDGEPERTRIKGGVDPHVVIDRQTAGGHERLATGEQVRAGDLLQVSYVGAGRRHGVILSIDGAGVVTLHHPSSVDAAPELAEGKEVPLRQSYELDDAPGYERFVFVTRDDDIAPDVDEVLRAAETLARDPQRARDEVLPLAGEHWRQHFVLLPKTPASADSTSEAGDPVPAGRDERGAEGG